jgi:NAD(P)-dependent dehydrogenase (short-subunit alcohol dehydrogenase family)
MQKTVLITGCSSGIGAALAHEFRSRGHLVYATARRVETLASLERDGATTLPLDVNDDASIAAALEVVDRQAGRLDLLINNAGFSQVGAVIDLTRDDLRRQYETNVISPAVMTGHALPLLRAAVAQHGRARVANVGSIVGVITTPFAAAYCSSKAALHSITDGLRMELSPLGISVVSIQPGGVRSSFGDHASAAIRLPRGSLYEPVERSVRYRAQAGQQDATDPVVFARPVVSALLRDRAPRVIRGGRNSVRLLWLKRLLPAAMLDAKMMRLFGLDTLRH